MFEMGLVLLFLLITSSKCVPVTCFDIASTNTTFVCSGRGNCVDYDNCTCLSGYEQPDCASWSCYSYRSTSSGVCSGHGECLLPQNCSCAANYDGEKCEIWSCGDIDRNHNQVCYSHGICEALNLCKCVNDYSGVYCETAPEEDEVTGDWRSNLPGLTEFGASAFSFLMTIISFVALVSLSCCYTICCVTFCCCCCMCCDMYRRWKNKLPVAPLEPELTFAFTDIRNSTKLWNTFPKQMRSSLKKHDKIVRKYLKKYNGYEVKTIGDAFFVTFKDPIDALKWACIVQRKLLKISWPKDLLRSDDGKSIHKLFDEYGDPIDHSELEDDEDFEEEQSMGGGEKEKLETKDEYNRMISPTISSEDGNPKTTRKNNYRNINRKKIKKKLLYKGLVLRMGMHLGRNFHREKNRTFQTFDYLGQSINKCARVEGCAKGGFIYCSSNYFAVIRNHLNAHKEKYTFKSLDKVKLKGFKGEHMIYQVLPYELRERDDDDIRTLVEELNLCKTEAKEGVEDEEEKKKKIKKRGMWMDFEKGEELQKFIEESDTNLEEESDTDHEVSFKVFQAALSKKEEAVEIQEMSDTDIKSSSSSSSSSDDPYVKQPVPEKAVVTRGRKRRRRRGRRRGRRGRGRRRRMLMMKQSKTMTDIDKLSKQHQQEEEEDVIQRTSHTMIDLLDDEHISRKPIRRRKRRRRGGGGGGQEQQQQQRHMIKSHTLANLEEGGGIGKKKKRTRNMKRSKSYDGIASRGRGRRRRGNGRGGRGRRRRRTMNITEEDLLE